MTYSIKGKIIEYKTVRFQVKSVDEDQGIVTGTASKIGNVDQQKDLVEAGSYKKTLTEASSRLQNGRRFMYACLWMHDPTQPIGGVMQGQEESDGLLMTMKYDISTNASGIPNNPIATMVFSGFKSGYIDELSIGYIPVKWDWQGGVRHLKEIQLIEVSAVTMLFAANPEALVPASGVKMMDISQEKPQRKDFDTLFQAAQAADCLEDLTDLLNTFTQATIQAFGMGDQPQQDMAACLEQFGMAVNKWVEDAIACNLKEYIAQCGYCGDDTPYVPYSMRMGGYDSMSRSASLQGNKSGRAISAANQSTLEDHQSEMNSHIGTMKKSLTAMEQKVSDLTQLWKETDRGEPYGNDKSHIPTHREPPQALTYESVQPLQQKSTVDDETIADLEALFS